MRTKLTTRHWVYIALAFFWLIYVIQNKGLNLASLIEWLILSILLLFTIDFLYKKFLRRQPKPKVIPSGAALIAADKVPVSDASARLSTTSFFHRLRSYLTPRLVLIVCIAVAVLGAFYWYEWRPSQARKECVHKLAEIKGLSSMADIKNAYELCLHARGF